MSDLTNEKTGELIDELIYRAHMRGEPYIRQYANDLIKYLDEMKERANNDLML